MRFFLALEPHVFALGDQAFVGMRESKCDQCIVISGESGSGKTVAANDIIRFLMQLANQGHPSPLELMIANTSPILEVCSPKWFSQNFLETSGVLLYRICF